MPFNLSIPQPDGSTLEIALETGDVLFVLGANGSGKSNLMHKLFSDLPDRTRRISAHRQNWFESNGISLSSEQRRSVQTNIHQWDMQAASRWRDNYASFRPNVALYDLVDAENVRARSIASAVDSGDVDLAKILSHKDAHWNKRSSFARRQPHQALARLSERAPSTTKWSLSFKSP